GQFINVHVKDSPTTFVRRPFSIHTVDYEKNSIQFMMKVVGDGTNALSKLNVGDSMDVVFPLGNGFAISDEEEVLLVGGGYGIAPLYHVAQELMKKGKKPNFLFGAKTETDFILLDKFRDVAPLYLSTEDGSIGYKGLVIHHPVLKEKKNTFKKIYTCGPERMMEAVAHFAENSEIQCEASLDQVMGCGIGVCLSCVKKTVRGNEATCLHGPVFNTKDITW
ncbi:dihydroorotate dehydrogenase electron transfer subunit, partial [Bacteroidota bacterium]